LRGNLPVTQHARRIARRITLKQFFGKNRQKEKRDSGEGRCTTKKERKHVSVFWPREWSR